LITAICARNRKLSRRFPFLEWSCHFYDAGHHGAVEDGHVRTAVAWWLPQDLKALVPRD
jgi:hypothetical protein